MFGLIYFFRWLSPELRSRCTEPVTHVQTHILFVRSRLCHANTRTHKAVTACRFMRRPGRNPKHTCGVFPHAGGTGADLSSVMKYFAVCVSVHSARRFGKVSGKVKVNTTPGARNAGFPITEPSVSVTEPARRRRARVGGSRTGFCRILDVRRF